ncbi:tyrosine-type recombinase/integrase [Martelella soudanensis]|uniref:tyrosine-type recombinase/integrase n=1 Tax=unclassified Martelella TaxID=2629616 RepID=UPI0015E03A79|nr:MULTISPECIES: tyrosine-type recombinase/integrase [unclassified Martelella]
MPLEHYKRGNKWWVRGRADGDNEYINRSLGTSDEEIAKAKIRDFERKARQRAILGDDAPRPEDELDFASAVKLYRSNPASDAFLLKVIPFIGHLKVKDIKPKLVRYLGVRIYPGAATDTWRRQVVTPICAVINNAHELGKCQPIRVRAYTAQERIEQDKRRGKVSRQAKTPGSWEWLSAFRSEANPYLSAMALFMFTTGARIGQAVEITPDHLDLQSHRLIMPPAKGHQAQWVEIMAELVAELANLPPRNGKVFGYASRHGVYEVWKKACARAGIEYIPPHAAGRHGFGTELTVRQGIDPVTAAKHGRWSSPRILLDTYAHAEDSSASIHDAFRRGKMGKSAKPEQGVSNCTAKQMKNKRKSGGE